ncbi:hypothetical protein [Marinibacterium sp. SX1]|uniref:hypothetical protein n=1 Tax=Marinibacterium sp. SX1 TaxID=3388424 RepID=UPI003D1862E5
MPRTPAILGGICLLAGLAVFVLMPASRYTLTTLLVLLALVFFLVARRRARRG